MKHRWTASPPAGDDLSVSSLSIRAKVIDSRPVSDVADGAGKAHKPSHLAAYDA
jgi:hypothetical protein